MNCVWQYTFVITLYKKYDFFFTHFAAIYWSVLFGMSVLFVESQNFISESCRVLTC